MRPVRRIAGDRRGVTVIEFAIVVPVMMLLVMGLSEIAYQGYLQSILTGALQKAGRDSTIQGNDQAAEPIDAKVIGAVRQVSAGATYVSSRKSYAQFGNIKPEYYYDDNGNNQYDSATECFIDVNGNGLWDKDPGITGQGGASDVVLYTMTVTYPRLFPMGGLLDWAASNRITAKTLLKNQPYASQKSSAATKKCPNA